MTTATVTSGPEHLAGDASGNGRVVHLEPEATDPLAGLPDDLRERYRQKRRWRLAVHEAGHAVAVVHLLGVPSTAAIAGEKHNGVTFYKATAGAAAFREAVVAAVGACAGRLAAKHRRPGVPEISTSGLADALSDEALPGTDDEDYLRAWCCTDPLNWRRIRERLLTVRWAARCFVREHADEIVEVAKRLWTDGVVTLEPVNWEPVIKELNDDNGND